MSLIQLKIKLLILPAFVYNLNFDIWKFGHPQCANSANGAALSYVNIMGNHIGKEGLSELQVIMKEHRTLQSLCGIAPDATEANLSGLRMDVDDAAVLAADIQDKGAMSILNVSNNQIGAEGAKALVPAM